MMYYGADELGRLRAYVAALEAEVERLQDVAVRDSLTNLYNRGYLTATLEREIARAYRENRVLSLLFLDIDDMKRLNDTYGHVAVDDVLRKVGLVLKAWFRVGDVAARYGGDEFVVVLPGSTLESARERAGELQTLLLALNPELRQTETVKVSIGVAAYPVDGNTPDQLLAAADRAMYKVKRKRS